MHISIAVVVARFSEYAHSLCTSTAHGGVRDSALFKRQIITRLSTGYLLIYLWLASQFVYDNSVKVSEERKWSKGIIRWMVMYAMRCDDTGRLVRVLLTSSLNQVLKQELHPPQLR